VINRKWKLLQGGEWIYAAGARTANTPTVYQMTEGHGGGYTAWVGLGKRLGYFDGLDDAKQAVEKYFDERGNATLACDKSGSKTQSQSK
jgi:hypothetical protein